MNLTDAITLLNKSCRNWRIDVEQDDFYSKRLYLVECESQDSLPGFGKSFDLIEAIIDAVDHRKRRVAAAATAHPVDRIASDDA